MCRVNSFQVLEVKVGEVGRATCRRSEARPQLDSSQEDIPPKRRKVKRREGSRHGSRREQKKHTVSSGRAAMAPTLSELFREESLRVCIRMRGPGIDLTTIEIVPFSGRVLCHYTNSEVDVRNPTGSENITFGLADQGDGCS